MWNNCILSRNICNTCYDDAINVYYLRIYTIQCKAYQCNIRQYMRHKVWTLHCLSIYTLLWNTSKLMLLRNTIYNGAINAHYLTICYLQWKTHQCNILQYIRQKEWTLHYLSVSTLLRKTFTFESVTRCHNSD